VCGSQQRWQTGSVHRSAPSLPRLAERTIVERNEGVNQAHDGALIFFRERGHHLKSFHRGASGLRFERSDLSGGFKQSSSSAEILNALASAITGSGRDAGRFRSQEMAAALIRLPGRTGTGNLPQRRASPVHISENRKRSPIARLMTAL